MSEAAHETPEARLNQTVAGFNIYRTPGVRDQIPPAQVSTWYQGILVSGAAEVLAAEDECVVFALGAEQIKALEHTRTVFVESPVHGICYSALIADLNPLTQTVTLAHFQPFRDFMERRDWPRVPPSHAMLVRITAGDQELCGRVVDISVKSLCGVFERDAMKQLGDSHEVDLHVWGEHESANPLTDFNASGEVIRVNDLTGSKPAASRVVIGLTAYPALERVLNTYVARRELEVMATLAVEPERVFEQTLEMHAYTGKWGPNG